MIVPSKYQAQIYHEFEFTNDSLLIEAVAGSGKTSTLIELANIMQRAFPMQRAVMVAFNRSIANELHERIQAMAESRPVETGVAAQLQRTARLGMEPWVERSRTMEMNTCAMTLHSAGWAAWRRAGGLDWEPRVDAHKVSGIMREVLSYEENKRFGDTTRRLVGYAKAAGIVPGLATKYHVGRLPESEFKHFGDIPMEFRPLVGDTDSAWEELIDHYGLDAEDCNIDLVRRVLGTSLETSRETCDFDDMLYMPVVAGVPFDRYDVVLVDEAQDVSGIQMEMISRMVAPAQGLPDTAFTNKAFGGRVIAVGDRAQSIYGFRGAGTTSMDILRERFQMRELPLSVSYRCPRAVVQHAQQWVPQIEAREDAPDGVVMLEGTDWRGQAEVALGAPVGSSPTIGDWIGDVRMEGAALLGLSEGITKWRGLADFQPGDAILCRLTRPLVAAAFTLIRNRIAAHVLGRDIAGGLTALIKKSKLAPGDTVARFEQWMDDYQHRETTRLENRGKHAQAGLLGDKCDTLRVFMERAGDGTVGQLAREVEALFTDGNGAAVQGVTLSTIHKFKGSERDRIFVLDAGETLPCKWARQRWELQQERNLAYVAATRAKRELRYITTFDLTN